MSSLETKIERLEDYLERENARHDEALKERPTWWHAGKILLGLFFVARSASCVVGATGLGKYALAALLFTAGVYLTHEGILVLRQRRLASATP